MVGPPLPGPPAVLPSRVALPATHSNPAPAVATDWPARSPAPLLHSRSQTWCAALHAAVPLRSVSAPALPHPTALVAAMLPEGCMSHCRAQAGPGTTSAAAHTTAATPARATPAPAPVRSHSV